MSDGDGAQALLAALGYRAAFRYQKFREVWEWKDAEIVRGRDADRHVPRDRGSDRDHPRRPRALWAWDRKTTCSSPIPPSSAPPAGAATWSSEAADRVKAMVLAAGLGRACGPLTLAARQARAAGAGPPAAALDPGRAGGGRRARGRDQHAPPARDRARGGRVPAAAGACGSRGPTSGRSWARAAARAGCGDFFGDEPFLLVNGDVFFDFDLRPLVRAPAAHGRAGRCWASFPIPIRGGTARVTRDARGRIRSIAGQPRPARVRLALHGHPPDRSRRCSIACRRVRPIPCATSTFRCSREGERVEGVRLRGAWYDLGAPPLYLASQLAMIRKRVPGRTPRLASSVRGRPSATARGCRAA